MRHITRLLPNYITLLGRQQIVKEYPEPMPIREKYHSISVLPSCPTCGATLDLKLLQSFGSRHIITNDAKLYYCNNPLCAPDEEEGKHRLLPFSWNSHYHM